VNGAETKERRMNTIVVLWVLVLYPTSFVSTPVMLEQFASFEECRAAMNVMKNDPELDKLNKTLRRYTTYHCLPAGVRP
jgi:hypothetical protein